MSRLQRKVRLTLVVGLLWGCQAGPEGPEVGQEGEAKPLTEQEWRERAWRLSQQLILVDTHIDVPYRMRNGIEDISTRTAGGDFDYPRAREGGLDAAFMSIYVPASYQETGGARAFADRLIDLVEGFAQRWPQQFALATRIEDIEAHFRQGKFSLALGIENGAAIEEKLENLNHFYRRGVRYITLTHSKNNLICDASHDPERRWNGLSPFGEEVVREMNRLGIMVDVSHVSDEAFDDVMRLSRAPVIASHSSCRHFTPGFERNMSDEMIRRLGEGGGVIFINFGSSFINDAYRRNSSRAQERISRFLRLNGLDQEDPRAQDFIRQVREELPHPFAHVSEVADHIDHVVRLVGVDHVGFGSDFDGVGDSLPEGLKDVSQYPNLLLELLKRGYSREEIEKIASGNLFRVWREVERVAAELGGLQEGQGEGPKGST